MAEKDLGYRRIQCTGRGSYIISLPKEWVQDVGLKRGSEIAFNVEPDFSLKLVPRKIREKNGSDVDSKLKEYYISVDPNEEFESILRLIQALYVISADIMRIHFKGSIENSKCKNIIKNFARDTLLGSEVIDETDAEITLQILIKHSEFSIEKAVRRMSIVALAANRDAVMALKNSDKELLYNVVNARNDVNRLMLYVVRQLKYGLEHNMYRELGFSTPKEYLLYRMLVNNIKNIGEDAINIINNKATFQKLLDDQVLFLKGPPIDEEVYTQIINLNTQAHQIFEEATKAMFKRDYNDAEKIIPKRKSCIQLENDLILLMSTKKLDPNVASLLRLVLDSSRRILDYGQDIAELTLNRTVEELCQSFAIK